MFYRDQSRQLRTFHPQHRLSNIFIAGRGTVDSSEAKSVSARIPDRTEAVMQDAESLDLPETQSNAARHKSE
jgi:hypothetical protein